MSLVVGFCALLVMLATLLHYEALRWLSVGLSRLRMPSRAKLLVVALVSFAAHVLEIGLYGVAIHWLAHQPGAGTLGPAPGPSVQEALYFSAETYTSLGYGDLVPHGALRALAGVETLSGLLLIGWTASFLYMAMQRFWSDDMTTPPGQ
jgi:hypothetical protein